MELTLDHLERCFNAAKEKKAKYVGILVSMKGFPAEELIVNEFVNYDKKLEYYKNAYNDNLTLKATDAIKIVAFTYGNSLSLIENDLIGEVSLVDMCKPIKEHLKENYNPHTEVVISMDEARVVVTEKGIPL